MYGYDIIHFVSNIADPKSGSYKPYRSRGDTQKLTINTAGYVTNGYKDVSFWIPFSEPIIGNPTVTVNGTLTLRQDGKYTHGSYATTPVTPDKYEVTRTELNGIAVKAVFKNATAETSNAINNDAIGILFNGTIVFS